MRLPIYLDYMATTPVDPVVAEKMCGCLGKEGVFGNPASKTHAYGWEATKRVEAARKQVAALINAEPNEIVWTSGATESDNLALIGAAQFYQRQGKHIITMGTEHKAVLDSCAYLSTQGFELTYLNPDRSGLLLLDQLKQAIRRDTILISIMHVNNETGVIQDIKAIAELAKQHGVLFHVDAAQSAGKVPIDVKEIPLSLLSLSSHKLYGPKGIGALYVRRTPRVQLVPLMHGGNHENGLRSGTLATHQIVGMGEAYAIAKSRFAEDEIHIKKLRQILLAAFNELESVHINGDQKNVIPGCFNVYIEGVHGEALMMRLHDLALSSRSACNSTDVNPSHVLLSMGLSAMIANNSLRISFGRFTTEAEMQFAAKKIVTEVSYLRQLSPG